MITQIKPEELNETLELIKTKSGTEKIDLLNSVAYYLQPKGRYREAQKYSEESKKLSEKISYNEGLARSLYILAKCFHFFSNYIPAIEHLNNALTLLQNFTDKELECDVINLTGNVQLNLGDYSQSLQTHFKNLENTQSIGDKHREAITLMNIGNAYLRTKEIELALDFYNQSLALNIQTNSTAQKGLVLNNIGSARMWQGKLQESIECYTESLAIAEKENDKIGIGEACINLGNVHNVLKEYDKSLDYFNKGREIFIELNNHEKTCITILSIGLWFMLNNQPETGLQYLNEAHELVEKYNLKDFMEHIYQTKSNCYKQMGDYKKAFEEFEIFYDLEKKHSKEATDVRIQYLNVAHKVNTIQKESEILASKNEELETLNNRLKELNDEKNEFMGIAAHDLKNPLASISLSATSLKKYYKTFSDEKIENYLDKIAETSKRMKNIISNLLDINAIESGSFNIKKTDVNLSALVKYLCDDYEQSANNKNITIKLITDDNIKVSTDEAAIYEILDNLISNAVKYSNMNSEIIITLQKTDKLTIEIKDNGPGIKEDEKEKVFQKFSRISNKPTGGENSTGLGLSIVKKLTELIDGKIYFESEYGKGTTFTLELPL